MKIPMKSPEAPPELATLEGLFAGTGLVAVEGRNFTGRTDLLRHFVGLSDHRGGPDAQHDRQGAFIGPEIYNALSGLALSVEDEIRLHAETSRSSLKVDHLLEMLGLEPLSARNPFDLSGGEQALTALAAALALEPKRLSLDCCFEQVDADMRDRILHLLCVEMRYATQVALADNRLQEYSLNPFRCVRTTPEPSSTGQHPVDLTPMKAPTQLPLSGVAPEIVLDGVRFSYQHGATPVVRDLSATLQPGNVYLLEGRNGSGKSTLAKILCGILRPQKGMLRADGDVFCPWREPGQVFAYHFQNPDLQLFCSSVNDELGAGPRALRTSAQLLDRGTHFWAEVFGLSRSMECHPLDLPFVGRKRVALAATLTMARRWLILDEPTLGQDDETSQALVDIIKKLTACHYGVVVISHSVDFRRQLAGRHLLLEGGILAERD